MYHQLVIWVNGRPAEYLRDPSALQLFSEYAYGSRQAGCVSSRVPPLPTWHDHENGRTNSIRLGEVSELGSGSFPRNQSADMTLDEFHLWRIKEPFSLVLQGADLGTAKLIPEEVIELRKQAVQQWAAGRYFQPRRDAVFTSAPIRMDLGIRSLPPPVSGAAPRLRGDVITGVPTPPPRPRTPSEKMTVADPAPPSDTRRPRTRLLGFSWTWHPEEISRRDGHPIALDYRPKIRGQYGAGEAEPGSDDMKVLDDPETEGLTFSWAGLGALDLAPSVSNFAWNRDLDKLTPFSLKQDYPQCTVVLRVVTPAGGVLRKIDGDPERGFTNAGFSVPTDPATGRAYELSGDEALQYDVRFKIEGLQPDSILLGTPVFDDITFYLARDEIEYLSLSAADSRR